MKRSTFILLLVSFGFAANAQTAKKSKSDAIQSKVVEIACGECQFKMKGKDCDLAIRIDGKPYFVDGKKIDDFGDAHDEHGFCNAISKAVVSGKIVKNRFQATDIKLVETKKKGR